MPEYLRQNEAPLEQTAKKYLANLKVELLTESLYSLQLMKWALENPKDLYLDREVLRFRPELQGWVESLMFAEDQSQLPSLLGLYPNPLPKERGPELAKELLSHLRFVLLESDPGLSLSEGGA
jgi:hypothetical protein